MREFLLGAAVLAAEWLAAALLATAALGLLLWALRQRQRELVRRQALLAEAFERAQAAHRLEAAP